MRLALREGKWNNEEKRWQQEKRGGGVLGETGVWWVLMSQAASERCVSSIGRVLVMKVELKAQASKQTKKKRRSPNNTNPCGK
jgi:hypothetical protein